jgi:hypothetical protein
MSTRARSGCSRKDDWALCPDRSGDIAARSVRCPCCTRSRGRLRRRIDYCNQNQADGARRGLRGHGSGETTRARFDREPHFLGRSAHLRDRNTSRSAAAMPSSPRSSTMPTSNRLCAAGRRSIRLGLFHSGDCDRPHPQQRHHLTEHPGVDHRHWHTLLPARRLDPASDGLCVRSA